MFVRKKSNDILVIKKYRGSWIGIVSMAITTGVSLICYVIVLVLLQNNNIVQEYGATLNIVRDILLSVLSIISTTLLTSIFIEKNRKNVDYTELIANDVLASPEFYNNLTEENKEKMYNALEQNMFLKDRVKNNIYQVCRNKINANPIKYYYNELQMCVSYFDFGTYSEKRISRVMKIRSYNGKLKENKLFLFSYQLSPTEKIKNFEIISACIGEENKALVLGKDIIVEASDTTNIFWNKRGYKQNYDIFLNKDITLYDNEDLIIMVEYVSRVTDEDMSSGFGVRVPCKNFTFNFTAPPEYLVFAHPYCFLNSEANSPNSDYPNIVSLSFNNWLLPGEGVAISVAKKNSPHIELMNTDDHFENKLLVNN